ncbi:hypothetical protein GCM10011531_21200 [Aquaticitalea lipolytica]|uniref:DUF306 domain-containing protein n=2 Tax=Aquaticitalea lipolytica TaxID=1247562 RepID=A0A8J2TR80_9FLAO|nr:hypothetical protein GCM10011531_21200 [Aquaticitalea lipolytica]
MIRILNMSLKYKFILLCFCVVLSCAQDKKESQDSNTTESIENTSWLVVNLKGETEFSRQPTIRIDLSGKGISGSSGCNRYFGDVTINKNQVKISNVGSTKMMCNNINTEQLFFEALNEATFFKAEGNTLKLMSKDKKVIIECSHLKEGN